jgi:hypothetical protein
MIEKRATGIYNATGADYLLTIGDVLSLSNASASANVKPH